MSQYTQITHLHYDGRDLPPAQDPVERGSDRERLLQAVIPLVARSGYENTTVAQVITAAGVSLDAFERHYAGKEECFLDGCLEGLGQLAAELGRAAATAPAEPPEALLEATLAAFLGFLAARPDHARCFLLDMPAVGAEARYRFLAVIDLLAENSLRWHERVAGADAVLDLDVYRLLSGGVSHLCTAHAHDGSLTEIPGLLSAIMEAHLAVLLPARWAATRHAAEAATRHAAEAATRHAAPDVG